MDNEASREWDEEQYDDELEANAYDSYRADQVHARPVYLGSGHSEFPCGVDARTPAMVAAFPEDVTCPGCKAAPARKPAPFVPRGAVHAKSTRVAPNPGLEANAQLVAPCGISYPAALARSPWKFKETDNNAAVTCPGCRAAVLS